MDGHQSTNLEGVCVAFATVMCSGQGDGSSERVFKEKSMAGPVGARGARSESC